NATRNKVQNGIRSGNVLVNNEPVKPNYKVKAGDEVRVVFSYPPREDDLKAQDIPLNIIYEDDDLCIVDKEAGMVVHPGHGHWEGTLVNALKHHFDQLPSMDHRLDRPGLVHRIDKETSGLLVIAKTELAMQHLAGQFFRREIHRRYKALVWGDLSEDQGRIEVNLARHKKNRLQMAAYPEGDEGKTAITNYQVLERLRYVTLCECRLETGRTHQIRAHMKFLGHPLFNDERYGGDKILAGTKFSKYKQFIDNCFQVMPRMALHAAELGFIHPSTSTYMAFKSELPQDFQSLLDKWRNYGDEPFFIDQVVQAIDAHALDEDAKSFDRHVLYGKDIKWPDVINLLKQFPMFGTRQLVLLKEAQLEKSDMELLEAYVASPAQHSILV
ncbi:unnamed protein product, partial [Cyprideis torosa]